VIGHHGTPTGNCLRVAIALEEVGLAYAPVRVDLHAGEHKASDYLALNPDGRVPVIVDEDMAPPLLLTQSNAILFHIDARCPDILLPAEPRARAIAIEHHLAVVTDLIAPSHAALLVRRIGETGAADALDTRSAAGFATVERYLTEAPFVSGDRFGLADIAALTLARASETRLDWAALPRLDRWFGDMLKRPSVVRGLKAFD
jgi:GST-like protein